MIIANITTSQLVLCPYTDCKTKTWVVQAKVVRACKAKFDEQLSRVYTRVVYQEYKKQYNNSTMFVIEPDPDPRVKNGWLVKHENGEGSFCWAQHAFMVVADKDAGEYSYECKQWEHTCMVVLLLLLLLLLILLNNTTLIDG